MMAIIKKIGTNKHLRGCREIRTIMQCWEECKMVQLQIEEKSKRAETCPHTHLYINVYSIIIHNRQRWEPKSPSMNEWINKMWYIYTVEYYSAIKGMKMDSSIFHRWKNARTWMNLKNNMLNEKHRQKRHIMYDFQLCISQDSPE